MFKAIGDAAYKAAAATGLAAGTEQPPYPCALPLRVITDPDNLEEMRSLADEIYTAARDLLGNDNRLRRQSIESGRSAPGERKGPWDPNSPWRQVDYKDPNRDGDFMLMTKPHIGPFNFAKATMTFRGCTPEIIISTMFSDDFATRKKFSADLAVFKILARPTPTMNVQYHEYHAPPPVSPRHLIYLFERRFVPEEDTHFVYGCSIDYAPYTKLISKNTIGAVCLWCWGFTQVGDDTLATYSSVMNPNGWAPTFIVGWMKGEIGKELTTVRNLICDEQRALRAKGLDGGAGRTRKPIHHTSGAPTIRVPSANSDSLDTSDALRCENSSMYSSDAMQYEDERPQEEEELVWRELEESEELLLF